ncbi:hypothetical protein AXF42_Ash018000 [Apostasia shenzhenica]|uniref:Uncharacterized protein n=1 Tax=Apostasia shenzhenica TaxID=1088818 RepID=A0A2I0A547_9ASPA|nr:hypothetical protein AXF42_Ash018000 [Apostasia shenzhenica]
MIMLKMVGRKGLSLRSILDCQRIFREWDIQVSKEEEDDVISKKDGEIESSKNVFKVWDLQVSGEEDDDEAPFKLNKKVGEIESSENVFKVDLHMAEEKYNDELLTELNEAVAVLNIRDEQKLSADGGIPTIDEDLKDLITNFGDLSLKPNPKNIGEKSSRF